MGGAMPIGHGDLSGTCGRIRDSGFAVTAVGHGGSGRKHGKMASEVAASSPVTTRHL